jgi:hypothetical protein
VAAEHVAISLRLTGWWTTRARLIGLSFRVDAE